ncbi:MAG: hypothetical protein FD138_3089 [Planctomycetota bacterium]|nr:MAG: hypothetical protein FD138_3089 [Planctomycetota bacterium]
MYGDYDSIRWPSFRHRSQQIRIAREQPFAVLLFEDAQGMSGSRHGWCAAGRSHYDGELGP